MPPPRPHLFAWARQRIAAALETLQHAGALPSDIDLSRIGVDAPRDKTHGDLATNAALLLAKPAAAPPMRLAAALQAALQAQEEEGFAAVSIAPPGFVNLTLTPQRLRATLRDILLDAREFGRNKLGGGRKINVEYVSANPTGPLHIGHARGAVFGDALATLLEWSGFAVCREYYINDAGAQVEALARSAHLRYREALGEDIPPIPDDMYPGDYLRPVGEELAEKHNGKLLAMEESAWLKVAAAAAIDAMMNEIRADLLLLGIDHDVFTSERNILWDGGKERVMEKLEAAGLLYEGVPPPPKGKEDADWQPRKQLLFRATAHGDDADRPLLKQDGSGTYFLHDSAYHLDKYERGFADMIDIWGADHGGYIKRMQAAVSALTDGKATLDIKLCQIVRLFRRGELVKMSKRGGEFVTLQQAVEEAGADAVRFMMLFRKNDATLDFDFAKVVEKSRDNPVFYVQYAHARACSALRKAKAEGNASDFSAKKLSTRDFAALTHASELELVKRMASFPHVVECAALAHEPHRIAFHLYDIAAAFHMLWTEGKRDASLRFLASDDSDALLDRMALLRALMYVLSNGLSILGVTAPEEM